MADYTFAIAGVRPDRLVTEITAAGLPLAYVNGGSGQVTIYFAADLTAGQQATLATVVAAHVVATPDENTDAIRIPPRVIAALVQAIETAWTAQPALKAATPAWARNTLDAALAVIQAARS